MSFPADWTRKTTEAADALPGYFTEAKSTSGPLEGGSSLLWNATNISSAFTIMRYLTSGADVTTGKIRTIVKLIPSSGADRCFGLCAMIQSAAATANAYWLYAYSNGSSGTLSTTVALGKGGPITASGGSITSLASAAFSIVYDQIFALELKWQRDAAGGGVVLTMSGGHNDDFSDLAPLASPYTDAASFYSTTISAGYALAITGGGFQSLTTKIDRTVIARA